MNNVLKGEFIGQSIFRGGSGPRGTTAVGLDLMGSMGLHYSRANQNQLDQALEIAMLMPAFPDPGSVKRMNDFIVVRISNTLYRDQW